MKKLAILLVLLIIGATIPAATVVAAAVVKPAMQAAALPKPGPTQQGLPTVTTLHWLREAPSPIGGSVSSNGPLEVGGPNPVTNSPVQIYVRCYDCPKKSWEQWRLFKTVYTDHRGDFNLGTLQGAGTVQFRAVFPGSSTLRPSISNVLKDSFTEQCVPGSVSGGGES